MGLYFTEDGRPVKVAKKGLCDIYGIICIPDWPGIHVEVEVKTGNAKLTREQGKWQEACSKLRIIHVVARGVKESIEDIERVLLFY